MLLIFEGVWQLLSTIRYVCVADRIEDDKRHNLFDENVNKDICADVMAMLAELALLLCLLGPRHEIRNNIAKDIL
jgi:hypothetical protein